MAAIAGGHFFNDKSDQHGSASAAKIHANIEHMKVLIIYVSPRQDSFCRSLLHNLLKGLRSAGHETQVADLYAEKFNPIFSDEDYAQFAAQPMPPDVLREQERIEWCEGIIVIAPIWWYQFPAMLKGWIERVFSAGWAFEDGRSGVDTKSIGWRKLLILASAGAKPETFEKYGYTKGIEALWNVGIWEYCGFKDIQTEFFWRVQPFTMSEALRDQHMERVHHIGVNF